MGFTQEQLSTGALVAAHPLKISVRQAATSHLQVNLMGFSTALLFGFQRLLASLALTFLAQLVVTHEGEHQVCHLKELPERLEEGTHSFSPGRVLALRVTTPARASMTL